jgi:hypothetical protein
VTNAERSSFNDLRSPSILASILEKGLIHVMNVKSPSATVALLPDIGEIRRKPEIDVSRRIHTGKRPYACIHPGCGKTFTRWHVGNCRLTIGGPP